MIKLIKLYRCNRLEEHMLKEILLSIEWATLVETIWTVVMLPFLLKVATIVKDKIKLDKTSKYTKMLVNAVEDTVKEMYQTVVESIKNTEEWTEEKKAEIKAMALIKIRVALSAEAYNFLTAVNEDYEEWVEGLIESTLYDLKKGKKKGQVITYDTDKLSAD